MKGKLKRNLQNFLFLLFLGVLFFTWAIDSVVEFIYGFMDALDLVSMEESRMDPRSATNLAKFLGILLILVVLWIMKRKVSDPVKRLAESMECVREGNLDTEMKVVDGLEFGRMEESFNSMVKGLREARELQEQNAEKNRKLYAEIAHDLKTPMTMILGYARLLSEGAASPEKQKEYLDTIVEQTENANALLEQMLEYAKLGSTEYRLDLKEGDLAECLRQVTAESYYRFEEKGMELDVQIPDEAVTSLYDERQMKRVFFNLIGNVICHNPEGTKVKITLKCEEGHAEAWVADDGPLIEKELKDHLFEPFQTGDASRNSRGGNGLGLSVAKKIVQLHGGDLEYRDELMQGYKGFVITMPLK